MLRDRLFSNRADHGFRWRGAELTRIEGLSDGVFALATTLLIVSLEVPREVTALLRVSRALPSFALSFAMLFYIWSSQNRFFRRYGLQDGVTLWLNGLLLFLVLAYVYRTDHHLALAQGQATSDRDPREVVAAPVRRLEALRRAGIVEREAEGVWRIPGDLAERGRQYDAQRLGGGVAVELKSHLPIERQACIVGATWLDQQLIGGGKGLGDLGFGAEVKDALRERADFLAEQGLAAAFRRLGPCGRLIPNRTELRVIQFLAYVAAQSPKPHYRRAPNGNRGATTPTKDA